MHLLNTQTCRLQRFFDHSQLPQYATLSHCWGPDEVTFEDMQRVDEVPRNPGYAKLRRACQTAQDQGLEWLWADTVCIDRSSTAALTEAVNSSFRWYQQSQICLVYLDDFESGEATIASIREQLSRCRWMWRSWTLQELVAPISVQFFDRGWSPIGSKQSLLSQLADITGIDEEVLRDPRCIDEFSVGRRMSWAAKRSSSLVEDVAYSLAGIFKVSLQALYGEGRRAFITLQERIMDITDDASLFAWQASDSQPFRGLLAHEPSEFGHFASSALKSPLRLLGDISRIAGGFSISELTGVERSGEEVVIAMRSDHSSGHPPAYIGITLRQSSNRYVRCNPQRILHLSSWPTGAATKIRIKRDFGERESSNMTRYTRWDTHLQSRDETPEGFGALKRVATDEISTNTDSTVFTESSGVLSSMLGRRSIDMYTVGSGVGTIRTESQGPLASPVKVSFANCLSTYAGVGERFASPERISHCPSHTTETPFFSKHDKTVTELDDSGEDDMHLFTDPPPEKPELDPNHPFYSVKNELTEHALEEFARHSSEAQDQTLSTTKRMSHGNYTPPHKRRKPSFDVHLKTIEQPPGSDGNEDTVMVEYTKPKDPSFACPFYRQDPARHRACLLRADLASIRDLKQHLWTCHRRPYFCSVCHEIFGSADECDNHVRSRTCSLSSGPEIEGVTEDQVQQLAVRSDRHKSAEEQWADVASIVLPERAKELSPPHLTGNVETLVCLLRKYWAHSGQEVIAEFLQTKGMRDYEEVKDEERNLEALYVVVLDQMVDRVADRLGAASKNE